MSPLSLRRALLLSIPLALVLAGCNLGQGKSVAGPDVGNSNPSVGQAPSLEQPTIHCTGDQLKAFTPCQENVGSVCTPENNSVVDWDTAPCGVTTADAPELTWTYPCIPDGYDVELLNEDGSALQFSNTDSTYNPPEADGRTWSWLPGAALWDSGHRYAYTVSAWLQGDTESPWDRVWSEKGIIVFYTGPFCVESIITPPDLLYPENGEIFREEEQSQDGFSPEWWASTGDSGGHYGDFGHGLPNPCIPGKTCPTPAPLVLVHAGFTWEYPPAKYTEECSQLERELDCLTPSEGQVSTDSTFATGVMPILTSSPLDGTRGAVGGAVEWCHTYYWRVRSHAGVVTGPWSETYSFKIAPPEGWSACLPKIQATAIRNASCRLGPSTRYAIAAYVPAGESHPVEGRNADGTWYKLQDLGCYINRELLALEQGGTPFPGGGDVGDLLSVLPDPPLPTVKPTEEPRGPVCSPALSPGECTAGGWKYSDTAGRCVCP
jgi:hypothetical protein